MEKVTGIGGLFFRVRDPVALGHWYQQHLGVTLTPTSYDQLPRHQEAGPSGLSPFPQNTDYFGDPKQMWMVNLRVQDLDAMIAQLRAAGIAVDVEPPTVKMLFREKSTDPSSRHQESNVGGLRCPSIPS